MSDNNLATKQDLSTFYNNILPYLGGGMKLAGPVGMIISYMGTTAPSGYLACDGSWYDIGLYPKLANWMMSEFGSYSYFALSGETVQSGKFKVPDLRGEFLRGTGTNAHSTTTSADSTISCGSGLNVGEHQDPTVHINFTVGTGDGLNITGRSKNRVISSFDTSVRENTINSKISIPQSETSSNAATFYTSRPTNTSVLYCIKYEEYEGDGRGVQYSTEEQVIGTWIDSKPIYQKTFVGTTPSSPNTETAVVSGDFTNWNILQMFGNVDNRIPANWTLDTNIHNNIWFPADKKSISMIVDTYFTNKAFSITVQYTKTT